MSIKHALIVDDSKSARLVLSRMLQSIGLVVDMVESGEEAVNYLSTKHPDAIFMDHMMPGMDGLQTVQAIKDKPNTATIPIAMYTSKEEGDFFSQVKAHGVIDILPKPPTLGALSTIMEKLNAAAEAINKQPLDKGVAPADVASHARPTIPIEEIKTIAEGIVKSVIAYEIQTHILPAIEARIAQLKREMLAEVQIIAVKAAAKVFDARSGKPSNN